jgi:hypothetical protein
MKSIAAKRRTVKRGIVGKLRSIRRRLNARSHDGRTLRFFTIFHEAQAQ